MLVNEELLHAPVRLAIQQRSQRTILESQSRNGDLHAATFVVREQFRPGGRAKSLQPLRCSGEFRFGEEGVEAAEGTVVGDHLAVRLRANRQPAAQFNWLARLLPREAG